jgi:ribonuclease VapC
MIVDSSAVVAILRAEPEANAFTAAIENETSRMSAVNYVEAAVVMDSVRDPIVSRRFDDLIQRGQIALESVTEQQAHIARQAYRDFGKGSGHPARLNFADCFAYALAKDFGEPLLFKGDDFSRTDVTSALP